MTWSLYTAFLPTDWISRTLTSIKEIAQSFAIIPSFYSPTNTKQPEQSSVQAPTSKKSQREKVEWNVWKVLLVVFIICYALTQIYLPTRYLWTSHHRGLWDSDNDQYFHWRMMMTSFKSEKEELEVVDPISNQTIQIIPYDKLSLGGWCFFLLFLDDFSLIVNMYRCYAESYKTLSAQCCKCCPSGQCFG